MGKALSYKAFTLNPVNDVWNSWVFSYKQVTD